MAILYETKNFKFVETRRQHILRTSQANGGKEWKEKPVMYRTPFSLVTGPRVQFNTADLGSTSARSCDSGRLQKALLELESGVQ